MRRICTLLASPTLSLLVLAGCGKKDEPKAAAPVQATPVANVVIRPELHKPFKEAIVPETPNEAFLPPQKTITGKSIGMLYEQVAGSENKPGLWEQVRFVTPDGKPINYSAIIKTDLGEVEIALFPEAAPNHVRSFLCLAKVGYFNGLAFDRIQKLGVDLQMAEAGCPVGTGEVGYGSIGYWLLPELSETLTHEEGTVGTWHGESLETAACKFYITLTKAPAMDGRYSIFGKVVRGLDVVRAILDAPVKDEDRPVSPVLMREVIIRTSPEAAVVAQK